MPAIWLSYLVLDVIGLVKTFFSIQMLVKALHLDHDSKTSDQNKNGNTSCNLWKRSLILKSFQKRKNKFYLKSLKLKTAHQPLYILSSRAAFLPDYRNQIRTLLSAIRVTLGYSLKYPTRQLWFVSSLMQPKVYRLFASRSKRFYPRAEVPMPEDYLQVLDLMQNRHVNVQQRSEDVFVHPCVLSQTTPEQLIRL
ncbi:hypothetical protein D3C78_74380 [compost metagenome]